MLVADLHPCWQAHAPSPQAECCTCEPKQWWSLETSCSVPGWQGEGVGPAPPHQSIGHLPATPSGCHISRHCRWACLLHVQMHEQPRCITKAMSSMSYRLQLWYCRTFMMQWSLCRQNMHPKVLKLDLDRQILSHSLHSCCAIVQATADTVYLLLIV